jgi:PhzF family phenazine biosynthesis protein
MQVDAFTDRALGGNPCAVVFDADTLDDGMRQSIAQEMNLSETAFVQRAASADAGARYFTPDQEIPLAGHPTIATVFALFESGPWTCMPETAVRSVSSCRRCDRNFLLPTTPASCCRYSD